MEELSDAAAGGVIPQDYSLTRLPPDTEEYCTLRSIAGLSTRTADQSAGAVSNSWAWTTIRSKDGSLVSMGRVIGDGAWYFHIADVATDPGHQRLGLGRAVMEDLVHCIDQFASPHPYITLLADPPGQRLYRSLGFIDSAPSLGMRLPR